MFLACVHLYVQFQYLFGTIWSNWWTSSYMLPTGRLKQLLNAIDATTARVNKLPIKKLNGIPRPVGLLPHDHFTPFVRHLQDNSINSRTPYSRWRVFELRATNRSPERTHCRTVLLRAATVASSLGACDAIPWLQHAAHWLFSTSHSFKWHSWHNKLRDVSLTLRAFEGKFPCDRCVLCRTSAQDLLLASEPFASG